MFFNAIYSKGCGGTSGDKENLLWRFSKPIAKMAPATKLIDGECRDLSFPGSGLEEGHFGSIDSRHALMLFKFCHFEFFPQF